MTVNELMRELRIQQKYGNGKLEVELFAHDHNPKKIDEGVGIAFSVSEFTNEEGYIFIAIRT